MGLQIVMKSNEMKTVNKILEVINVNIKALSTTARAVKETMPRKTNETEGFSVHAHASVALKVKD